MSGGSDEQAPDASGNQKQGETVSDAANDQKEEITYTAYNVTELFDALNNNALNAQQAYKDQYVEITGYLGTIDSSGKYIGVGAKSDDYNYFLDEVLCYIKNDDQLNQIAAMSKDDSITLRGKIAPLQIPCGYAEAEEKINFAAYLQAVGEFGIIWHPTGYKRQKRDFLP